MADRKLQQIALASFNYRHEAEFAAGFLDEAGIPYLLQIEDPALGLSATNAATIWVRAVDEKRARRVLEHDMFVGNELGDEWAGPEEEWVEGEPVQDGGASRDVVTGLSEGRGRLTGGSGRLTGGSSRLTGGSGRLMGGSGGLTPSSREPVNLAKQRSDLTLRARVLAIVGGSGVAGTLILDAVRQSPLAWWAAAAVAVLLAVAGLFGRAPSPLRGILQALSGDAP